MRLLYLFVYAVTAQTQTYANLILTNQMSSHDEDNIRIDSLETCIYDARYGGCRHRDRFMYQ